MRFNLFRLILRIGLRSLIWVIVRLFSVFLSQSLQQSHLKVEADGTLVQKEILTPPPPPSSTNTMAELLMSVPEYRNIEFMNEIRDALKKISTKIDVMTEEMTFLRELVIGPRTPVTARTGLQSMSLSYAGLNDFVDVVLRADAKETVIQMVVDVAKELAATVDASRATEENDDRMGSKTISFYD